MYLTKIRDNKRKDKKTKVTKQKKGMKQRKEKRKTPTKWQKEKRLKGDQKFKIDISKL